MIWSDLFQIDHFSYAVGYVIKLKMTKIIVIVLLGSGQKLSK